MTHTHKEVRSRKRGLPVIASRKVERETARVTGPKLEVVLKCDSEGSLDAVAAAIAEISVPEVDVSVVGKGLGSVTASDVFFAKTAGRLIVGFQVDVLPGVEKALRERNVEVRLYNVIYMLTDDLKILAESIVPHTAGDEILGSAKVIALFKSSRKAIITGCEVVGGRLAVGQHFRVISAMGPVYSGTIESMHAGQQTVQTASQGQHVGIKIRNFTGAKVGDLVESYRPHKKEQTWKPTGGIIRK